MIVWLWSGVSAEQNNINKLKKSNRRQNDTIKTQNNENRKITIWSEIYCH